MQICTSLQRDNHASTPPLSFLQAGCPSCHPTNSVKALKGKEICIVINDKSQGSIAKHLRCDESLYYTFITQSAGERIVKTGEHLAKLQAKWLIVSCAPFTLDFCPQRRRSGQIS